MSARLHPLDELRRGVLPGCTTNEQKGREFEGMLPPFLAARFAMQKNACRNCATARSASARTE